jgi:uncharacterized membrane protein YeaQ/YmgE (transglycosylase-associated protein family)
MGVISWILVGASVGVLANGVTARRFGGGVHGNAASGMAGAFLAGAVFSLVAKRSAATLDVVSLLAAVVGAAALLALVHRADRAEPRSERADGESRAA